MRRSDWRRNAHSGRRSSQRWMNSTRGKRPGPAGDPTSTQTPFCEADGVAVAPGTRARKRAPAESPPGLWETAFGGPKKRPPDFEQLWKALTNESVRRKFTQAF
ncbi:hypothetical protein SKAU_G00383780 [Synaphobranchus kaupii]|uniref:Uncharacterized protein n=1 Tax=Synaphobranchus kaupii TaxID=118154 RepID=A0A9Q1EE79_SYNKA|nr:hypothetical protein SKAU_G00383780 [Synaphobranchus kaupii]